jgi:hypothetical protein
MVNFTYRFPDRDVTESGHQMTLSSASVIKKPKGEVGRTPNGYKLKDTLGWTEGNYVEIQVENLNMHLMLAIRSHLSPSLASILWQGLFSM